jgi:hypothetical protein
MLQSIYAVRPSNIVLSLSASHDVWTDDSDVTSNLDTGEGSATRVPCDNLTRMSDAPIPHKSAFLCRGFAFADGKVNLSCPAIRCAVNALVMVSPICWSAHVFGSAAKYESPYHESE